MMRRIAGAVMLLLFSACGGSDGPQGPGAMAGSYVVTGITCGGGAGPPLMLALTVEPNSDRLVSADGYAMAEVYADAACTISLPLQVTYPSPGTIGLTGAGNATCAPSLAACATLSGTAGLPDGLAGVCGLPVTSRTSTYSYGAIPAVGGTMTLTATGGPASLFCESAGLTGPFAYTVQRE